MKPSVILALALLFFSCPVSALSGENYLVYSPNITYTDSQSSYEFSAFFGLSGDNLVWENIGTKGKTDGTTITNSLFLMNISTNTTTEIYHLPRIGDPYYISPPPSLSGDYIAWSEEGTNNIFLYTISEQKVQQITTDGNLQNYREMWINANPVVNRDMLAWAKDNPYGTNKHLIIIKNLTGGTLTSISVAPGDQDQTDPSISGNLVVWSDKRNESGGGDVYLFDMSTSKETAISTAPGGQKYAKISNTTIVWRDYRDGRPAVYLYDLSTHTESRISDPDYITDEPFISGNFIVWQEYSVFDMRDERESRISVYSITTGSREILPVPTNFPRLFGIDNNRILYANPDDKSMKEGYVHIYRIDTPAPAAPPQGSGQTVNKSDLRRTTGPIPVEDTPAHRSPVSMSVLLCAAGCGILFCRKKLVR